MSSFIAATVSAATGMLLVASSMAAPAAADPKAEVPPVVYRSVFGGHRSDAGQGPGSWRELNDTVGRIGGWRAYAREAQAAPPVAAPAAASSPEAAPRPPVAPSAPSGRGGHDHHKMH
jgi:hypothetical protein